MNEIIYNEKNDEIRGQDEETNVRTRYNNNGDLYDRHKLGFLFFRHPSLYVRKTIYTILFFCFHWICEFAELKSINNYLYYIRLYEIHSIFPVQLHFYEYLLCAWVRVLVEIHPDKIYFSSFLEIVKRGQRENKLFHRKLLIRFCAPFKAFESMTWNRWTTACKLNVKAAG